jgi:two-component system sensor histidine kinase KdpD
MEEKDLRPNADALLKEVEKDDVKKGRLKIFLGYAPGVGKTFAMLNDAHVLKKRGLDVVVGIVETHQRADTEALLADLEIIPRKKIDYKGLSVSEMDLDAILARHPSVVLVDELAHTNIEGSRHPKRYQDIEELLEQGIDVHTTVNIQHFESTNDAVAKITGVRMQETLPDTFFDRTDEVQVVDIPWEELIQRLKEGKVYFPQQARRAIDHFFQRGNLFALRELMLTLVARKMDSELINYMRAKAIPGPWPATEKLVVCIAASPYAKQLIRKAYAIAKDTHAEWYAVYVLPTGFTEPSGRDKLYLTDALNLAEELGARSRRFPAMMWPRKLFVLPVRTMLPGLSLANHCARPLLNFSNARPLRVYFAPQVTLRFISLRRQWEGKKKTSNLLRSKHRSSWHTTLSHWA